MIPREIGDTNVQQLQREIRIITCKINDRIKSPQVAFGRDQTWRIHCSDGDWGPFITPGAKQNVAWFTSMAPEGPIPHRQ